MSSLSLAPNDVFHFFLLPSGLYLSALQTTYRPAPGFLYTIVGFYNISVKDCVVMDYDCHNVKFCEGFFTLLLMVARSFPAQGAHPYA